MNQQAYHKDSLKKTVTALAIAVTGNPNIDIMFASGDTRAVADKIYLSEPTSFTPQAITLWRGYIDRSLFKIAYHNVVTEQKYRPNHASASLLYSYLMQLRYEVQGIQSFVGALNNIRAVYEKRQLILGAIEERGLLFAMQTIYPQLVTQPVIDINSRNDVYLQSLKQSCPDIKAFAKNAARFATYFCSQDTNTTDNHDFLVDGFHKDEDLTDIDNTLNAQAPPPDQPTNNDVNDTDPESADNNAMADIENNTPDINNDTPEIETIQEAGFLDNTLFNTTKPKTDYKIYTTEYDTVIEAEKLVSEKEIHHLHGELMKAKKSHAKVIHRLSRKLRARLISVQDDCHYYDLYQGNLDHQKISKILTDPFDGRYFKDEMPIVAENTAVTLLIDNSGSMRGKPITMAALCADIIAETIERCGAKVEVLGFTTQGWRGGQSRKDYEKQGCPPMPGRLNDLHHIIYKDFNMPYKAATRSISVMLKESLLKENIDGEALLWATQRLSQRPEKRKILTVISDGAPVDDSTHSANNNHYLEDHLKKVLHYFENKSDIDIFALGIGHDVQSYYKKAVTVPNADSVAEALTEKFVRLF
ncbi:MAG: cobaltochelatase CobT [Alphaproteobacteria bacterium]|jgi:cobaltochelatase CobT